MSKSQTIPRDMVMVLDTSGSMRGPKMDQARRALKYCLSNLNPGDRFGVMNFAMPPQRASAFSATAGWQPVSNSTFACACRSKMLETGSSIIALRSASGR
jgi:uncharacterized protein (DUF58 family)